MIDKIKIAHSFGRSATTYDSVAYLQRDIGNTLLQIIDGLAIPPKSIQHCLDLGCGTGYFQPDLQQRFGKANHIACDLSKGMLDYVKTHRPHQTLLCADAEALPIKPQTIQCIFSNLALQWCENLDAVFAEAHRVLTSGGIFCLSTLGPQTLCELKNAWAKVDQHQHVNTFFDFAHWQNAATQYGFTVIHGSTRTQCLEFDSLKHLSRELKELGAHNMNPTQAKSLTSRQRWRQLQNEYQHYRHPNGQYPATYEIYYFALRKE